MKLLNDSLLDLVKSRTVDPAEAYLKSIAKDDFVKKCATEGISIDRSGFSDAEGEVPPQPQQQAQPLTLSGQPGGSPAKPQMAMPKGAPQTAPKGPLPQTQPQTPAPAGADPFSEFKKKRGY